MALSVTDGVADAVTGSAAAAGGPAPSAGPSRRRVVAMTVGNAVEFYDFTVYVFFAVPIGRAFFPAGAPLTSLLLSVAGAPSLGPVDGANRTGRAGARRLA